MKKVQHISTSISKSSAGERETTGYDVVFLSLAQNCAATIENLFSTMDCLGANGIICAAFVGENGSEDTTREIIKKASTTRAVTLVDTSFADAVSSRLEKMARLREFLREVALDCVRRSRFVCVVDVDSVLQAPLDVDSINAVLDRLACSNKLYAVSATSFPWYYDLLAYKSDSLSFEHLESEIKDHQTDLVTYYRFHKTNIFPYQMKLTKVGEHLCASAFNGLCFYRSADYEVGSYLRDNNFCACEHLAFNKVLSSISNRQMLVSLDIAFATPPEHEFSSPLRFYWQRFRRRVREKLDR